MFSLDVKTPAQRCLGTEKPGQKEKDPMGRDEMGDTPGKGILVPQQRGRVSYA